MTEGTHRLGDVLRTAREAKGVDLARVERDTKIRERYLSSLERGEYRELPGAVYTRGFLRNYGAYLGLDPEYLIDLYRLETSVAPDRPTAPSPPRPLAARRSRAFVVTPGAIVAAILTVLVGGFVAYLGYEFINFARTPELRIVDPAGNVNRHAELEITLRGISAPNARITVAGLRENPTVEADATGAFEVTVGLVPGSNVVRLTARDPVTGRDSETEERTIVVAGEPDGGPTTPAAQLRVVEPAADSSGRSPVGVAGTATPGAAVQVSAAFVGALEPSFTVTDALGAPVTVEPSAPPTPDPVRVMAGPDGAFDGTIGLRPGRWELTIVTDGVDPAVRAVTVEERPGLAAVLRVRGGDSYVELDEDGAPAADLARGIATDGQRIDLGATESLRIRVGNAGAVRLTLNGFALGPMGEDGAVVEWRIERTGG